MKSIIAIFLFILLTTTSGLAQSAPIRGKVADVFGEPVLYAIVVLTRGNDTIGIAQTDLDGNYMLDNIGVNSGYLLRFWAEGMCETQKDSIAVTDGAVTQVDVDLIPLYEKCDGVVNKGTTGYISSLQRRSPGLLAGISSREIAKNNAQDLSSALRQIGGVSIEGDRYIYVRGLGDRYSTTLLNGGQLPGLDPERNTIQMDIFPASIIENAIVHKTFTPDLPGNFSGSLVNINTKHYPEEFFIKASIITGINTATQFSDELLSPETSVNLFSEMNPSDNTTAFANKTKTPLPNTVASLSFGNQTKVFGSKRLGFTVALDYKVNTHNYNYTTDASKNGAIGRYILADNEGDSVKYLSELFAVKNTEMVKEEIASAFGGLNLRLSSTNNIGGYLFATKTAQNTAAHQEGIKNADLSNYDTYNAHTQSISQKQMLTAQLKGEHIFFQKNWRLDWLGAYTYSSIEEPNISSFIYGIDSAMYIVASSVGKLPTKYERSLDEYNVNGRADLTIPFVFKSRHSKLKVGTAYWSKDRKYRENQYEYSRDITTFDYSMSTNEGKSKYLNNCDITPDASNNYDAEQEVWAFYGMAELPISNRLSFIGGVRAERTIFTNNKIPTHNIDSNIIFLPSVNFKYNLNTTRNGNVMNLRLMYNKTIARPSFREITPFRLERPEIRTVETGNPDLKITKIHNLDLRWEYYFGNNEEVSASLFYKLLENPIEKTFKSSTSNPELSYQNSERGNIYGVDMNFKKAIKIQKAALYLGGNTAYIGSAIVKNGSKNNDYRRTLQGVSPFTAQAFVTYQSSSKKTSANVMFDVFGKRVAYILSDGALVYEYPRPLLNVNVSQKLNNKLVGSLLLGNILNPRYKEAQEFQDNRYIFRQYPTGINFSIGLSWNFNHE